MLSQNVAKAFEFYGDSETTETQQFVDHFDTFFDCLNVRSLREHQTKRKPNLKPYRSKDDERLTVSSEIQSITIKIVVVVVFKCCSGWKTLF